MTVQKADLESFQPDGTIYSEGVINIVGPNITLEFVIDGIRYLYSGHELPDVPGQYELTCDALGGRTTLYRLPGTSNFLGKWSEKGSGYGLWSIRSED